ncbi:hypothetical protein Gotur_035550 [Gossypium turneri]
MKALLVMVCILLASTLFIPTSTMARQLTSMIDQCLTLLGGINLLYHVAVECLINPAYNLPRSSPVYPRIIDTAINFHLNLECDGEAKGIGSIGEFVMEYI